MAGRANVPRFGNWDTSGGNGQAYTAVFDNARAGKGSKLINPNDPEENEELAAQLYGARPAPPPLRNNERPPPRFRGAPNDADESLSRHRHERRTSPEDSDMRRSGDPPGRHPPSYDQPPSRRAPGAPGGRGGAEAPIRRTQGERDDDGLNNERLSAHANRPSQRETGRGNGPPVWERPRARAPSGGDEGAVMGSTASRTRLRPPGVREEPSAKGGALPKFGAWDVKDPNAGEGYTMIFQNLSNEKKEGGPVHIPRLNSDQPPAHMDSYGKQNHQPVPARTSKPRRKSHPACCTIL